jgi:hypothetical protein
MPKASLTAFAAGDRCRRRLLLPIGDRPPPGSVPASPCRTTLCLRDTLESQPLPARQHELAEVLGRLHARERIRGLREWTHRVEHGVPAGLPDDP